MNILKSSLSKSTAFWLTLLFLGFITAYGQDGDIISIDTPLVVLNATVTDRTGEPLTGLARTGFEVFEDNVRQDIAFFESHETPFAAIILIDTSGSMERRVSMARAAAIRFLSGIRPDDNVAIYNFDSKVSLVQEFSNLRDLVPKGFDLKASGWTVLNDAIYKAAEMLKTRREKRKAIIVLSDGADTRSGRSSSKALDAALEANATVYTVDMSGVNTGGKQRMQNRGALKKFAEKTGGRFLETPGGVQMREAFENIVSELGRQYTIGYYPTNTAKDGRWRDISLRVNRPDAIVRTRKGYDAPNH